MDYRYGSRAIEIDEFFRAKRSWSRVKDKIVGDYIDCYLKTVHTLRRRILIVDGFSGPGRFGDDSDGSPLIICKAINQRNNVPQGTGCLFSDARLGHREALIDNLAGYIGLGLTERPFESCASALSRAFEVGTNSTIFFYLDPYGIKDLEFEMVRQIYERDSKRSTEVLINFNFRTFMRMSGNWTYGDSSGEVSRKVKDAKIETINKVMGGDYWREIITDSSLDSIQREDAVMDAYVTKIRQFFTFAYAIPVKERQEDDLGIPDDQLAHYHLVFGTRSPRAVLYMNDVALNALEPYLQQFKDGLLFDFTPERYQPVDTQSVKNDVVAAVQAKPLTRPDIYDRVVPKYFMHRRKKDYRAIIDELTFKEGRLYPDTRKIRRANKLNDEILLSAQPWTALT